MSEQSSSVLLHVALQNGFLGDEVVVRLNGREVFRKKGVKTETQIGLGDLFQIDVTKGAVALETCLLDQGISDVFEFVLSRPLHVGVNLDPEAGFRYVVQYVPFRYM